MPRLASDIDTTQTRRIFEVLREETMIFDGCTMAEVELMSNIFKVVTFTKNTYVCKKDELVDFLGIIVHGTVFVEGEHQNMKELQIGDMVGHMVLSEMTERDRHLTTIKAKTDGIIAVLPFGEIKAEMRRSPEAFYKLLGVVSRYSMQTLYYNVHGEEMNPKVHHIPNGTMTKKLRDFYFKNPSVRAFLKGVEKRDEKYILNAMKNIEIEAGERMIRSNTRDRSIIFIAGGDVVSFQDDKNVYFAEGAILGVEQFLFNEPWPNDLICSAQATICKLSYEGLSDLAVTNANAASRLYKRIVKQFCYSQIYEKKKDNMQFFKFKDLEDDQLFIDFKLDYKSDKDVRLFSLMSQCRPDKERTKTLKDLKGDEITTMPYFLTAHFQEMMETSKKQLTEMRNVDDKNKKPSNANGVYKSQYLRDRLEAQNQKRRMTKGVKKTDDGASVSGGQRKTASGKGGGMRKAGESEEGLLALIEELQNDLKMRDEEFELTRTTLDKLTEQNSYLKQELLAEKKSKISMEAKLNKIVILKELDANFAAINNNTFFEQKNNKISSLNTNLYMSVNEQYQSSLRNSYVAKYAKRWLEKTRQRRQEREDAAFFKLDNGI